MRLTDRPLSCLRLAGILPILLAMAGGLAGVPAKAQQEESLVRVDTIRVEPLEQRVPVIGRLVARQAGVVAAQVDAPLAAYMVEVGDRVERGDVIALLDKPSLQATRDLEAADVRQSEAELNTAIAELKLAKQELNRLERLKSSAAFSQGRYDDVSQQVTIAEGKVHESEAAILSAKAFLQIAEIDLANTEIRAPYAGVISRRMTEAGAYVRQGDPVVRLVGDQTLEIEAAVPFDRLSGVTTGTEIDFSLDDGSYHKATVRAILPEENPLTRTRAVRLVPKFSETTRPLAVEQSATVHVPVGAPRDVLTVHKDAVTKRGNSSLVYVVKDGTAELRPVVLGEPTGNRFEVIHGLADGEAVVVRGNERLQPGDKVRIDGAS